MHEGLILEDIYKEIYKESYFKENWSPVADYNNKKIN